MTLCRHFGTCGGCAYQDMPQDDYRSLKRRSVADALLRHGIDVAIEDVVEVPPATRRRATLKAKKTDAGVRLGFHAARSHQIVDMQECLVLTPALAELVPKLREMLDEVLRAGDSADAYVLETEAGIDVALRWPRRADPAATSALARWAETLKLARIAANGEILVELARPFVTFGKVKVSPPSGAFLQPTLEGEGALQRFVCRALSGAKAVADLFAGSGTFTFPLAETVRVHAVELDAAPLAAIADAARATQGLKPVTTERRDLYKRPLAGGELARFDAVVLDPPRAGALSQSRTFADAKIPRIAYVSCDAESCARDAAVIIAAGYRLDRLMPVDQFLWSSHIELAALFARKR